MTRIQAALHVSRYVTTTSAEVRARALFVFAALAWLMAVVVAP